MAGVEVVGLVLGAVPLLISGMEHYGEGVRTIRKMKNAADEFLKLKTILEVECDMFENDLRSLLQGEVDDHILPLLLKDQSHPYWSDPSLEKCLKRRLGQSYEGYFKVIKAIDSTRVELMNCLKLSDSNGKAGISEAPFDEKDKKSVMAVLAKIKFGLKMRKYQELVEEIALNSQRLNRLTTQVKALAPTEIPRRKAPDFEKTRQYASSLFSVLQRRLSRSCSLAHMASLHMRPMETPDMKKKRESLNSRRLRVVLQHQPVTISQTSPLWITEEAEVEPLDSDSDTDSDGEDPPHPLLQSSVRFAVSKPMPSSSKHLQQSLPEIYDLCASLHLLQARPPAPDIQGTCFGYLCDVPAHHHRRPHRHGLYRPAKPFVGAPQSTTPSNTTVSNASGPLSATLSLAEVLDPQSNYRLGEIDKKYLALALASGMLRLHHTPWLNEQWGRYDVVLFKKGRGLVATHPCVSVEILAAATAAVTGASSSVRAGESLTATIGATVNVATTSATIATTAATTSTITANTAAVSGKRAARVEYFRPCRLIKEQTVFALGILLIELAMERPFDSLIKPEDLNPDGTKHEFTDYCTADRLAEEEIEQKAGERYRDAVRRCIGCDIDDRETSLMNADFRKKVYDGVVARLQLDIEEILCM